MKRCIGMILGLLVSLSGFAGETLTITRGKVIEHIPTRLDHSLEYAVYLPQTYDPAKKYALWLVSEPGARAALPLEKYKHLADRYELILVASHDSRNYVEWEENSKAIAAMWADALAHFSIDEKRVYAVGFSGGARRSTLLAILTHQNIAGVIACGAGFAHGYSMSKENPFPFVGVVGNLDFNYLGMLESERDLSKADFNNRLIVFEGVHQWPPAEDVEEAFDWLQLLAWRNGLIPREALQLEARIAERKARAEAYDEAGKLYFAGDRYRALIQDYDQLADLTEVKQRLTEIENDKSYKKLMKSLKRIEGNERNTYSRMDYRLMRARDNREHEIQFLNSEMKWWEKEVKALKRQRDQTENPLEADSAARLLSQFHGICYERSIIELREENWRHVVYMAKLAQIIQPKAWFHHLNLIRVHAQRNKPKKAMAEMQKLVEYGFARAKVIEEDPLFDPLRDLPEFQDAMARIVENGKSGE